MATPTRVVRRSHRAWIPWRALTVTMGVAILAGGALGAVAITLDRLLLTPPPFELGAFESSPTLLSALAGGVITVAVFSLWMRTVVVGLVSDHFSPRTLITFLEDRFQQHLLGAMTGGLVTILVLLMGLPPEDADVAPLASTILAMLIAVAALAGVLGAIQHATRTMSLSELVSRLANEALEVLDEQPEGLVEIHETPRVEPAVTVTAPAPGWVAGLDTAAMLAAVPPGAVVHLRARVGDFVTPRSTLALVSLAEATAAERPDLDRLVAAVSLARTRSPHIDLAFALGQLVDVATHALHDSTDTATAHEVLVHLGAVLEAVVERGVPLRHDADADGRRVFDDAGWEAVDHVQLCVERLRAPAAKDPESSRHLMQLLGKVRDVAEAVEDRTVISEVGRQVEALLTLADTGGILARDRQRLQREADAILA